MRVKILHPFNLEATGHYLKRRLIVDMDDGLAKDLKRIGLVGDVGDDAPRPDKPLREKLAPRPRNKMAPGAENKGTDSMPVSKGAQKRSLANVIGANGGVPSAPANTTLPAIAGAAAVGQQLAVTDGVWDGVPPPSFVRQWLRAGVAIVGADQAAYTLVADDLGAVISASIAATNPHGEATAISAETAIVVAS